MPDEINVDGSYLRKLRQTICQHFDLPELQTIAFDLALNWDELAGNTLSLKCQSLIGIMRRNGRLLELLELLQQERPGVPWPSLPSAAVSPKKSEDKKRNIVWNALYESLWSKKTFLNPFRKQIPLIEKFSLRLWADFFNQPIDARPKEPEQILLEIRRYFFACDEKEFYRYLVFILNYWNDLNHYKPELINRAVNKALQKAGTGLQYVVESRWNRFESGFIKPIEVN